MKSKDEINQYLKRIKNGEKCITKFFNAISGHLKFVAFENLVDSSFVKDVVSIAFDRILTNIAQFDESQNGKAWISKITQNEAYRINNSERRQEHVSLDAVSGESACVADNSDYLILMYDLNKELDKLDKDTRKMVVMRLYDYTYAEIAQELNMHVGTVYKKCNSAFKKIQKEIL